MDQVPGLFSSIPRRDPLRFFSPTGQPKGQEITSFLNLKAKDVARAAKVSASSVRYDLKMPDALEAWLREVATVVSLVAEFFGDAAKTKLWFSTTNPQLGEISPMDMIRMGRVRKLLAFVQLALGENAK